MSFIVHSFAFDSFLNLNFKSLQGQNGLLHFIKSSFIRF
jgi:hypothetical protein